jgi:hypothetical protein
VLDGYHEFRGAFLESKELFCPLPIVLFENRDCNFDERISIEGGDPGALKSRVG